MFFRCVHGSMVEVITVANVSVISRLDYKLHFGNHGIEGASDNTGLDSRSLACLPLGFPGIL